LITIPIHHSSKARRYRALLQPINLRNSDRKAPVGGDQISGASGTCTAPLVKFSRPRNYRFDLKKLQRPEKPKEARQGKPMENKRKFTGEMLFFTVL